ncbi:MAG TPA: hypothetical protein VF727_02825 [Allosphingosinicella sp.]
MAANKGRRLQARRTGARKLFDARAKAVFLDWFTGTGNLSWASKKAGVHYRTPLRHLVTDPAFREAYEAAEAQSIPRLRAWAAQAKEEEARTVAAAALGGAGAEEVGAGGCEDELAGEAEDELEDAEEEEPGGDPAPENLSVEQALRIVEAWDRKQGQRGAAAAGGAGGAAARTGRACGVASNEEVRAQLVKALKAHGIRVRAAWAREGAERLGHWGNGGGDDVD